MERDETVHGALVTRMRLTWPAKNEQQLIAKLQAKRDVNLKLSDAPQDGTHILWIEGIETVSYLAIISFFSTIS